LRTTSKHKVEVVDEAKKLAQKTQAEKTGRDRELNQLRQQQEEQKQLAAQIKQIIELNRLPRNAEGLAYNFTDNNKVKRLYVSEVMRDQIAEGRLAIVKLGQQYEVVSAEVAKKIQLRDAASVIVFNERNITTDVVDDAYSEYQVPDDLLIW
jgi:uncharacterized protein YaiL (DUF2058 family)